MPTLVVGMSRNTENPASWPRKRGHGTHDFFLPQQEPGNPEAREWLAG